MGRTKKVSTGYVDTRSSEEKELDSIIINRNNRDLTEAEKLRSEELSRTLTARGVTHLCNGIGRFYAVMIDGYDDLNVFKLVVSNPDMFGEVPEVSIESPMGNAVKTMQDGDMSSYRVQERTLVITLIASADTYEELSEKIKTNDPVKKLGTQE